MSEYTKGDQVTIKRGRYAGQVITIVAAGTDEGYAGHNEDGELVLVKTSNIVAVPEVSIGAKNLAKAVSEASGEDDAIPYGPFMAALERYAPGITEYLT